MNRLRVGVVGVGALGRHHARILSEMTDVELVAVADSHPARGQEVAERCRTRWVADYRLLLSEVEAVSVVVPTAAHLPVASEFLRHGIPVLVEKPLAPTVAAGRELAELARKQQTLLQVGHIERFNPAWQAALPKLDAPKYLRAERLAPFTFRSTDVGVVLDLMIHDLDLVLSLVRSPLRTVEAFGIAVMGPHEDVAQARLTFQNGCMADLTASRIHPSAKRGLQAWTRSGCTAIDLHARTVMHFAPTAALRQGESPVLVAQQPGADIESLKAAVYGRWLDSAEVAVPVQDALTAELAEFVGCVRNGSHPLVNGDTALEALLAAERVLSQVASHQWEGHPGGAIGPLVIDHQLSPLRKAG
jgi:predicted dehydrogenase